jgi:ABC-2 type transport system ATP-binding protein
MISVNDLHFQYTNEQPLFDHFNLEIQRGELFGLLGPNRAGKSTLIALISGLYSPASGTIRMDDKDLSKQRKLVLQIIAVVPQDYAFYPGLKNAGQRIDQVIEFSPILTPSSAEEAR